MVISSLKTFVPPVTALLSPPPSRMTGADSPVIADSSTDAAPSMISPSEGIKSPALQITTSPTASSDAHISSSIPFRTLLALMFTLDFFKASACAFPFPSASDSAKFANNTVNHSQIEIWKSNVHISPLIINRNVINAVTMAPMSTRLITGFLYISKGLSFLKESLIALRMIFLSVCFFELIEFILFNF